MKSLKELYRCGMGPSSSHTIGPQNACKEFVAEYPFIDGYKVVLYGSLAKTGKGHMTDSVIRKSFGNICGEVEFNCEKKDLHHPNTMEIYGFEGGREVACWHVTSVGGGAIKIKGRKKSEPREVYPHKKFCGNFGLLQSRKHTPLRICRKFEGQSLRPYLAEVWQVMQNAVERGLNAEGILEGGLDVRRKAKTLFSETTFSKTV